MKDGKKTIRIHREQKGERKNPLDGLTFEGKPVEEVFQETAKQIEDNTAPIHEEFKEQTIGNKAKINRDPRLRYPDKNLGKHGKAKVLDRDQTFNYVLNDVLRNEAFAEKWEKMGVPACAKVRRLFALARMLPYTFRRKDLKPLTPALKEIFVDFKRGVQMLCQCEVLKSTDPQYGKEYTKNYVSDSTLLGELINNIEKAVGWGVKKPKKATDAIQPKPERGEDEMTKEDPRKDEETKVPVPPVPEKCPPEPEDENGFNIEGTATGRAIRRPSLEVITEDSVLVNFAPYHHLLQLLKEEAKKDFRSSLSDQILALLADQLQYDGE